MQRLEIGNSLVNASSETHKHTHPVAPSPHQVEEQTKRSKKVRVKGVLTDKKENAPQVPLDTTCSSRRRWKDLKVDREQLPIGWKQDTKNKHREKKRDKKTQRHCAAKSIAQETLSLLEYEMYNMQANTV